MLVYQWDKLNSKQYHVGDKNDPRFFFGQRFDFVF